MRNAWIASEFNLSKSRSLIVASRRRPENEGMKTCVTDCAIKNIWPSRESLHSFREYFSMRLYVAHLNFFFFFFFFCCSDVVPPDSAVTVGSIVASVDFNGSTSSFTVSLSKLLSAVELNSLMLLCGCFASPTDEVVDFFVDASEGGSSESNFECESRRKLSTRENSIYFEVYFFGLPVLLCGSFDYDVDDVAWSLPEFGRLLEEIRRMRFIVSSGF